MTSSVDPRSDAMKGVDAVGKPGIVTPFEYHASARGVKALLALPDRGIPWSRRVRMGAELRSNEMNIALLIIIVVAIVVAIVSGMNAALNWLLWVALVVGVIALIAFLLRVLTGNKRA